MFREVARFFMLAGAGCVLFSCVPARQFQEMRTRQENCQEELELVKEKNRLLNETNTELEGRLDVLEGNVAKLTSDTIELGRRLWQARQGLRKSDALNHDLMQRQSKLSQGNSREVKSLLQQIARAQEDLQQREDEVLRLEKEMDGRKRKLDGLREELEARNVRLAELEKVLREKDEAVLALKQKVSNALTGFENKGLSITTRNGKVYVSMDEKLLFKSGSYSVDPKGKSALKKLAAVLAQNTDINVMIEGHTDNVPYRGRGVLIDNWDLSVKRGTSIVRELILNKGIDPGRLIVAGRSKYVPVDNRNTPEARRKNRRTEIILSPKLDELFKILNNN